MFYNRSMLKGLVCGALAGVLLIQGSLSAQTLKADYQFNNTLASSVKTAPALVNLGENTFSTETVNGQPHAVLRFPEASGVALTPAIGVIPAETYTIIVQFRFATTNGYRRIIDFKNATMDQGLYIQYGCLNFYNVASGTQPVIQPKTFVQVMLTRDRQKNVCGYVNGRLEFTFVDDGDLAVISPANTLRFFRDDGPVENSAGAVLRIRLYDGPLMVAQRPVSHHRVVVVGWRRGRNGRNIN